METCASRDPKGLYARAARGELAGLTGVDAPYEAPAAPELVADTESASVDALVATIIRRLADEAILPKKQPFQDSGLRT